jgi:ABC-2 type transport system permease protein
MQGRAFPAARRVWGIVYRHLVLYRRSWPRLLELAYWPILQTCIWGFTSSFLAARSGSSVGSVGGAVAVAGGLFLGGVLLWEVTLRSQMGVAVSFLEELWSRNLGHIFVSPLRPWELIAALLGISLLRLIVGVTPAILLAWLLYAFNLFAMGPIIVLLFFNLIVMGWWVAFGVIALMLRYGVAAEALAWSLLFGLTPFSAVFYPVSVLPLWLQPISLALPSTHVFEGMRAALTSGVMRWDHFAWAIALNALWMIAAIGVFAIQFRQARVRGALLNIGE